MYLGALAETEKALGPNHTLTLSNIRDFKNLNQRKLVKAKQTYMQALAFQMMNVSNRIIKVHQRRSLETIPNGTC
jgi:hypothetical protein